ncbi:MAG: PHB depolymerase family esterase [Lysobacterales bacterium]
MHDAKQTDDLHIRTDTGRVRKFIFLCFCLTLSVPAVADTRGAGTDLEFVTTPEQLLGGQQADRYQKILAPDKPVSWQVYLPPVDPASPPGVLVYVSPMDTGEIDSRWRVVMDQQNLIYISANDVGNKIPTIRRMVMANLALKVLAQQYVFDAGRIYVSGFSGGGKVASLLATQYPEVFTGALYICGVYFWKEDQTPNVERVLENRFVFLTGSKDFNRMQSRRVQKRYNEAGAQHTRLIIVPGMAHRPPGADYLTEALVFLDGQDQLRSTK